MPHANNTSSWSPFCFAAIASSEGLLHAQFSAACNNRPADTVERRILPLVFWVVCGALHFAVICLYIVACYRHTLGTANGLKYVCYAPLAALAARWLSVALWPPRRARSDVLLAGTGSCSGRCSSSPYAPPQRVSPPPPVISAYSPLILQTTYSSKG
jgi:hypothetical protein